MKSGRDHSSFVPHRRYVIAYVLLLALSGSTRATAWEVARVPSGGNDAAACVLRSPTQAMSDGYHGTQAMIAVQQDAISVITQAPLDTSVSDLGIQVDQGSFIPIDAVVERKRARFTAQYDVLIEQFKKGHQAQVRLRFWPTWPSTGPHAVTFSLLGFTKAYGELQACQGEPATDNGQKP